MCVSAGLGDGECWGLSVWLSANTILKRVRLVVKWSESGECSGFLKVSTAHFAILNEIWLFGGGVALAW